MKYGARKKLFNRKYARAFSSVMRSGSASSRARLSYYGKSHMSRYGRWHRNLFS